MTSAKATGCGLPVVHWCLPIESLRNGSLQSPGASPKSLACDPQWCWGQQYISGDGIMAGIWEEGSKRQMKNGAEWKPEPFWHPLIPQQMNTLNHRCYNNAWDTVHIHCKWRGVLLDSQLKMVTFMSNFWTLVFLCGWPLEVAVMQPLLPELHPNTLHSRTSSVILLQQSMPIWMMQSNPGIFRYLCSGISTYK